MIEKVWTEDCFPDCFFGLSIKDCMSVGNCTSIETIFGALVDHDKRVKVVRLICRWFLPGQALNAQGRISLEEACQDILKEC